MPIALNALVIEYIGILFFINALCLFMKKKQAHQIDTAMPMDDPMDVKMTRDDCQIEQVDRSK